MSYDNYYRDMAIERGKIIQKVEAERDEARASYREALATIRRLDRSAEDIRDLVRSVIGTSADESNVEVVRRLVDHLFDAERDALNRAADEIERTKPSVRQFWDVHDWIRVQIVDQHVKLLRERAKRVPSDVIADLRARLAELKATRVVSVPFVSANEAANPQSDTHTDAQAAALDEAIKAVAVKAGGYIAFLAPGARPTVTAINAWLAEKLRAAAPIIRRQAEAERDQWRARRDAADENRRYTEQQNMELLAEIRDLRARLADAERAQADAEWELSNMRAAHDSACRTVADMHAAAVGEERSGPIRGVVEDVADVRAHLDGMRDKFRRLAAEISTGWEPLEQEGGLVYTAYKNAFKEAARRINVILEEES